MTDKNKNKLLCLVCVIFQYYFLFKKDNVARRKTTSQSVTILSYTADRAVDGSKNPSMGRSRGWESCALVGKLRFRKYIVRY